MQIANYSGRLPQFVPCRLSAGLASPLPQRHVVMGAYGMGNINRSEPPILIVMQGILSPLSLREYKEAVSDRRYPYQIHLYRLRGAS